MEKMATGLAKTHKELSQARQKLDAAEAVATDTGKELVATQAIVRYLLSLAG